MQYKVIELKTWPENFQDFNRGKSFEVRKDDRDFNTGDFLVLKEWIPEREVYTGNKMAFVINYILRSKPEIGLKDGYCIMAISKIRGLV